MLHNHIFLILNALLINCRSHVRKMVVVMKTVLDCSWLCDGPARRIADWCLQEVAGMGWWESLLWLRPACGCDLVERPGGQGNGDTGQREWYVQVWTMTHAEGAEHWVWLWCCHTDWLPLLRVCNMKCLPKRMVLPGLGDDTWFTLIMMVYALFSCVDWVNRCLTEWQHLLKRKVCEGWGWSQLT